MTLGTLTTTLTTLATSLRTTAIQSNLHISTRTTTTIQGDWHISTHVTRTNASIVVNGSVWLETGGVLELSGCTLQVLCTYDRQFNLTWRGGDLVSRDSTVGGHLDTSNQLCYRANVFVYDGRWTSLRDRVQCSYGVLFSPTTVGHFSATGLRAGVSPDAIIVGGRANVSLVDSAFALNLNLNVAPNSDVVSLDLPSNVALTETLRPAGSGWVLALRNTTSTHWFIELAPVVARQASAANTSRGDGGGVATFSFSARTSPFNLHLHTQALSGSFAVSHTLDRPVSLGNVVMRSADATRPPVRVAMFELYANTTDAAQTLQVRGIEHGGENMLWGPGTLELVGTGRANATIACTTCIVGGRGAGSGFGTMRVSHAAIGYLGAEGLRAQVLVRGGGGTFEASDVNLNDVDVMLEGGEAAMDATDCTVAGRVNDLHGGGHLRLDCTDNGDSGDDYHDDNGDDDNDAATATATATAVAATSTEPAAAAAVPPTVLPACRTAATPPPPTTLPRGVIDVVATFGADPTGATDATAALQRALTAARTTNVSLLLPFGCYRVTETLNATQPRNGRWQPIVVFGQRQPSPPSPAAATDTRVASAAWRHRPTLFLPEATPGFGAPTSPKPLLLFITNWCLLPGAAEATPAAGCATAAQPLGDWRSSAYQFNNALVDVELRLLGGNGGAVGIDMIAAQGSTLEDVSVVAEADALAGVVGGNGGGGSFKGLSVVGAKFGIDARRTGDAATLVAISLTNQSCAGLLQGSASSVIATGLRVEGAPALAGVVAGIEPSEFGVARCDIPPAPWLRQQQQQRRTVGGRPSGVGGGGDGDPPNPAAKQLHSAISLVDTVVALSPSAGGHPGGAPCIVANSSLYLSDVYASGCHDAVIASGGRPLKPSAQSTSAAAAASSSSAGTHLKLVAIGRRTDATNDATDAHADSGGGASFSYAFPAYVDGKRLIGGVADIAPMAAPPPADLATRHWVGAAPGVAPGVAGGATTAALAEVPSDVTWQSSGAVSAVDGCGATGDGATDDHPALQTCVDSHDVVVLPKGAYRLGAPLRLRRRGGALVGVGRTLSLIVPASDADAARAKFGASAVVAVEADAVTLGFVSIVTWDHLDGSTYALRWAGGRGVWRQAWFNRMSEASFPPFTAPALAASATRAAAELGALSPLPIDRPLSVVTGGGRFYDFNLDFGCCFGTAVPPPSVPVGPDMASSAEVYTHGPNYRTLLVANSTSGVGFYPLNAEQDFGEAHTEVRFSANVTFFGAKSENNYAVLWVRDSSDVTLHGYGGNAAAFANRSRVGGAEEAAAAGVGVEEAAAAGHRPQARGDGYVRRDSRVAAYMPSLFRVQRSVRVRLANLVDAGRVTSATVPSAFVAAGNGTDPRVWNMVLRQDSDGGGGGGGGGAAALCTPRVEQGGWCDATRVLDRPVLWAWSGAAATRSVV